MKRKDADGTPLFDIVRDAATAPQARHHFRMLDQVDALVEARESGPDVGFMARLLALCALPRTNPGDRKEYVRRNGPYALVMSAGGLNKLPYGNLPRLLVAWVCTEAVRTQSRDLVLGRSLSEFMRKLDILSSDSGGAWGIRTRLRNQMRRLFGCTVSLIYEDEETDLRVSSLIAPNCGGMSNGPRSRCFGTAQFGWVKNSSTKSSASPCHWT